MRIILKLSKNKSPIPFDYLPKLTGVIHKWLGIENEFHGTTSNYSFSWLKGTEKQGNSLTIPYQGEWRISAHETEIIKKIISGIKENDSLFCGIKVKEIIIQETPQFSKVQYFNLGSPILLKLKQENKQKFIYFKDEESAQTLTLNLINKMKKEEIPTENVKVYFDSNFNNAKTKAIDYKGITNIGSMCPVFIEGTQEQIEFAWNVGLGNSTGIGFGFLM